MALISQRTSSFLEDLIISLVTALLVHLEGNQGVSHSELRNMETCRRQDEGNQSENLWPAFRDLSAVMLSIHKCNYRA